MVWPLFNTETSGPDGRFTGADLNLARNFVATWVAASISAGAVTLPGDGKYRLTYSGAQNLDTISGTSDGDLLIFSADHTGAGGDLTIRHNQGNIETPGGIDIVINSDRRTVLAVHNGSVVVVIAVG